MSQKKLFFLTLFALGLVISCSKDDGPNTPPNTAPVIKAQTFNAAENISDATIIGTVTATDADKGDKLTFSIATNSSNLFEITNAGALSLAPGKTLDFDTKKQHVLSIGVSDGKAAAKADVTINVTEVVAQNQPPVIEAQGFEAAEDIADTDVIGTVVASDPEQDALTFSISTNDNDIFEIDASSGELSLAEGKALDFETAEGHTITVSVTDGVNDPVSAEITITVTNVYETLAEDPASFVTTWVTTVNNETVKIGVNPNLTYDFTIDWGDGTVEDITDGTVAAQHEYAEAGTHTVAIKGIFPAMLMDFNFSIVTETDALKLASIEQWGTNPWTSMYAAFSYCRNMVYNAKDVPDLSQVTDMSYMFFYADVFNGDLSGWDVSNVTDMGVMFYGADAFEGTGLSGWDVSNVTNMSYMFAYTDTFNGDISGWDVSSVTNMSIMFSGASTFNGDLSGWDVSNVTDMVSMFDSAASFNGDLSSWDTGNVTDMETMFLSATAFEGIGLSGWDVSNVTNMGDMFNSAIAFNADLGAWDIGSVTNMSFMLSNSGLSPENYSSTLTGWANYVLNNNGPFNIKLDADGLQYCDDESGGRFYLAGEGWNISDAGSVNCN